MLQMVIANGNNTTCLDSFGVDHIGKQKNIYLQNVRIWFYIEFTNFIF